MHCAMHACVLCIAYQLNWTTEQGLSRERKREKVVFRALLLEAVHVKRVRVVVLASAAYQSTTRLPWALRLGGGLADCESVNKVSSFPPSSSHGMRESIDYLVAVRGQASHFASVCDITFSHQKTIKMQETSIVIGLRLMAKTRNTSPYRCKMLIQALQWPIGTITCFSLHLRLSVGSWRQDHQGTSRRDDS